MSVWNVRTEGMDGGTDGGVEGVQAGREGGKEAGCGGVEDKGEANKRQWPGKWIRACVR